LGLDWVKIGATQICEQTLHAEIIEGKGTLLTFESLHALQNDAMVTKLGSDELEQLLLESINKAMGNFL